MFRNWVCCKVSQGSAILVSQSFTSLKKMFLGLTMCSLLMLAYHNLWRARSRHLGCPSLKSCIRRRQYSARGRQSTVTVAAVVVAMAAVAEVVFDSEAWANFLHETALYARLLSESPGSLVARALAGASSSAAIMNRKRQQREPDSETSHCISGTILVNVRWSPWRWPCPQGHSQVGSDVKNATELPSLCSKDWLHRKRLCKTENPS